jgi:hypothetical protein
MKMKAISKRKQGKASRNLQEKYRAGDPSKNTPSAT